ATAAVRRQIPRLPGRVTGLMPPSQFLHRSETTQVESGFNLDGDTGNRGQQSADRNGQAVAGRLGDGGRSASAGPPPGLRHGVGYDVMLLTIEPHWLSVRESPVDFRTSIAVAAAFPQGR